MIVDSCLDSTAQPAALAYLSELGLDPADAVCLVVATHWHDDHIQGIGRLVEVCEKAVFCCSAALLKREFLEVVGALETRPAMQTGSGLRELHRVFSLLELRSDHSRRAIANRLIFSRDSCQVWSLSPSDKSFDIFLRRIGEIVPGLGEAKRRIPSLTPNDASHSSARGFGRCCYSPWC